MGALSPEAHETIAVAMNRIGARSDSGEGGEDLKLLSLTAKKVFPYSTECKNSELHIGLYKNFRQAKKHNHREPLLVVKMNREKPLAIVDLEHLFQIHEEK